MITRIKEILKGNRTLHFWVTYFRDKDLRKAFHFYLRPNTLKKPRKTIRRELKIIRDYWSCPPYHYYLYKLFEKKMSDDELLNFLPPFYYTNVYWESRHIGLNKSYYMSKFSQHQLFTRFNIPSIEIIAKIRKGILYNANDQHITIETLINNYLINKESALFFKPEFGSGGHGIVKLSKANDTLFLNNRQIDINMIISSLSIEDDYLIQERFIQSKKMAEINKDSVNTLRICTQFKDGEIVVPLCILRMGINNSFIDNFCSGGLVTIINVEDGSLEDYGQTKELNKKYYEHPDSQYVFKGKRIDNWNEIKMQIVCYSYLLSECKDLGWDVAIGDNGIKILEINVQQGLDHQLVYEGFRKILDIYPELNKKECD
jgi:hypothetical protein